MSKGTAILFRQYFINVIARVKLVPRGRGRGEREGGGGEGWVCACKVLVDGGSDGGGKRGVPGIKISLRFRHPGSGATEKLKIVRETDSSPV